MPDSFGCASGALYSLELERAIRRSASWHGEQVRKGSRTPYLTHPMTVALILARLGFDQTTLMAALLHDTVEDTSATLDDLELEFGAEVCDLVGACSEQKLDAEGRKRSWHDRKRSHLELLEHAGRQVRAIVLADKLHNLISMQSDLASGVDIWSLFHADRAVWLAHTRHSITILGQGSDADLALRQLVSECLTALAKLEVA